MTKKIKVVKQLQKELVELVQSKKIISLSGRIYRDEKEVAEGEIDLAELAEEYRTVKYEVLE